MTATKNTILAFGLMLLTLASANLGAADMGGCGVGCEASCEANCQPGASGPNGNCNGFPGFLPQDFCHDPGCRYSSETSNLEPDPVFGEFEPQFRDLCERCAGCTWRVDASALALYRSNPTSAALLVDPTSGASLLTASDMQFPFEVGPRLSFVVTDCAGLGLELNFFAVDGWSADRDYTAAGFPSGVANLSVDTIISEPVTNAHIDLASMLYSSEINVRQNLCTGIDALCGFRWIDMHDRYFAQGTSAVTGNQIMDIIDSRNHLYGGQIGLDGSVGPSSGSWKLGAYIKGGGMLNNATSTTSLSDPANLGSLSASNADTHLAFFGEAGLTAYFQVEQHISISLGYEVMYVTNVAQPANQMAQTDLVAGTTLINVGSDVFYHGANLGMEVSW